MNKIGPILILVFLPYYAVANLDSLASLSANVIYNNRQNPFTLGAIKYDNWNAFPVSIKEKVLESVTLNPDTVLPFLSDSISVKSPIHVTRALEYLQKIGLFSFSYDAERKKLFLYCPELREFRDDWDEKIEIEINNPSQAYYKIDSILVQLKMALNKFQLEMSGPNGTQRVYMHFLNREKIHTVSSLHYVLQLHKGLLRLKKKNGEIVFQDTIRENNNIFDFVSSLALSPDEKKVAASSRSGILVYWDRSSSVPKKIFLKKAGPILKNIFFSSDNNYLIGSRAQEVEIWSCITRKGFVIKVPDIIQSVFCKNAHEIEINCETGKKECFTIPENFLNRRFGRSELLWFTLLKKFQAKSTISKEKMKQLIMPIKENKYLDSVVKKEYRKYINRM